MTPTLTDDQRRAVADRPGEPIRLHDPHTNRAFVLLPAEVYDRLIGEPRPADAYPAVDRAFAPGWDDPKMDDYDRYEQVRK
ncbi:MAG: hypothetical protein K2X82_22710 [Gemmataceae bacterium]|nr:hypothetical protein [Gemmataceae bacterium]